MPSRERERPVSSYEEYLRRYLPLDADDADDEQKALVADPEKAGEDRARQAIDKAVAQLTGSDS
jgi:hypothetical protein